MPETKVVEGGWGTRWTKVDKGEVGWLEEDRNTQRAVLRRNRNSECVEQDINFVECFFFTKARRLS